jgi:hypothetical protein
MAKINTNTIKITASKLVRDNASTQAIIDAELSAQIEAIVQELLGEGVLVEIELQ